MNKKLSFILLCIILINIVSVDIHSVTAEENVKDCLENEDDCLKDLEQPINEIDANETEITEESSSTSSLIFNVIKMILALFFVLALIYLLLHFLKRRNKLFQIPHILENLGGISVGQNKSIQLVRIGEKIYVVGVGENVEMLQEITDQEIIEELLQKDQQQINTVPMLQQFFKNQLMGTKENKKETFSTTLEDELHKIKESRTSIIDKYREKDE